MNTKILSGLIFASLAFSSLQAETLPDPGTLVAYMKNKGQSYLFEVTGTSAGHKLCGHLIYSPDSSLAMAAVYSGILKDGEKGVVKVTILPGFRKYNGGTRNGVTSKECGSHVASYKVESSNGNPALKPGPVVTTTPPAPATPSAADGNGVQPEPASLWHYFDERQQRSAVGTTVIFRLTGSVGGKNDLVGTDNYWLGSKIAVAAVHSGVLKNGETGVVKLTLVPGVQLYQGSTRNGVTSNDTYSTDKTECGFTIVRADGKPPASATPVAPAASALPEGQVSPGVWADPGSLNTFSSRKHQPLTKGTTYFFQLTGKIGSPYEVSGTDIYSLDSTLAVAAVHAGILKNGETGVAKVTILQGSIPFKGSTRNGAHSMNWDADPKGSFKIERGDGKAAAQPTTVKLPANTLPDPGNLSAYATKKGEPLFFQVKGVAAGALWGTDFYTLDSTLAAVAVHAGALRAGETGVVKVTIVDGRPNFQGSTRNGVNSANWPGSYPQCYRVEKTR